MKLLTLAILSLASTSFAATNGIDATFGSGGAVLIGPTPTSNLVLNDIRGIAFQSDGKIIVAGRSIATSGTYVGHIQAAIGRLDADGSWDTTFADHGLFVLPAGSATTPMGGEIKHVAVLSDGSVLGEGGSHHDSFGPLWDTCIVLLKLDSQGAPADFGPAHSGSFCYDLSPTPSSRPSDADGLAVNADGSFYVTSVTTLTHGAVAHFDAGGTLVSGYGTAGVVDLPDQVFTFILTPSPDGGLFATGGQYSGGTNSKIAVVKLRSDGTIDTGYGDNGVFFNDSIAGLVTPVSAHLDVQDRLLIADNDDVAGAYSDYLFFRADSGGNVDTAFNPAGEQPGAPGYAMPVVSGQPDADYVLGAQPLPDGHIFAVGGAGLPVSPPRPTTVALLRLDDDSGYDASFGDAAHPGWAAMGLGSDAYTFAIDDHQRAYIATVATDSSAHSCAALVRIITDRLFSDSIDVPADLSALACP